MWDVLVGVYISMYGGGSCMAFGSKLRRTMFDLGSEIVSPFFPYLANVHGMGGVRGGTGTTGSWHKICVIPLSVPENFG